MSTGTVAGFWSYAREDNELDSGAILELARLIMEEYNLLSGEELQLFIDRDNIAWGEQWRDRIDSALTQTTFFIPIVTPRYLMRPECSRELLEFTAKTKSLGIEELVLPILYVEPKNFSAESPHEVASLIAKAQYEDWRTLRLLDPGSQEYRIAVNGLARRLIDIAARVAEGQLRQELSVDFDQLDTDGITEIVERVGRLLPDWLDAVRGERTNYAQILATMDEYKRQLLRLTKSGAPASALFSAKVRFAKELLPLAERARAEGQVYLSRSVELDPDVSALSRLVNEHPDGFVVIMPLREAVEEAIFSIRENEEATKIGWITFSEQFKNDKHLGRVFQKCNAIFTDAERMAREGNDIVERWNIELGRQPDGTDRLTVEDNGNASPQLGGST